MKLSLIFLAAFLLLPACASLGKNCVEWQPKSQWYALRAGAVDRIDVYTCVSFSEVP